MRRFDEHKTRIRGRKWMRIIKEIGIRDSYICRACNVVTTQGEVDHLVPLFKDGSNDLNNLQWLCIPCHSTKTIKETGGTPKATIGVDGYPVL